MFKNAIVYRLPAPWSITAEKLEKFLKAKEFTPCQILDMESKGFVPPRAGYGLVYAKTDQYLMRLMTEKKLLPQSVINQVAKERAADIQDQQGYAPGRKQMKEIKEQVTDELLPRAFAVQSAINVWIDAKNGWLVIDSPTRSKAEDVIKFLLICIDGFPLQSLRTVKSPLTSMTGWLAADEAPYGFTVDSDTELRASGEGKATVRYMHGTIEVDDMRRHIATGKQCTRLALTWTDHISFVLTESLALKKLEMLDLLKENLKVGETEDARFDGEFLLMAGELNKLLTDLVYALGGEPDEQKDIIQEDAKAAA